MFPNFKILFLGRGRGWKRFDRRISWNCRPTLWDHRSRWTPQTGARTWGRRIQSGIKLSFYFFKIKKKKHFYTTKDYNEVSL